MRERALDERLGRAAIAGAAVTAALLAAWCVGAGDGRPRPPAGPWKHGVAFRLHALRAEGRS